MDYLCIRLPTAGAVEELITMSLCANQFPGEGGARNWGEGPCGAPLTRRGGLLSRPSVPSGRSVCPFSGRFSGVSFHIGYCYLIGHNLLYVLSRFPVVLASLFFSVVCVPHSFSSCDFCNDCCDFCSEGRSPVLRLLQCRGCGLRLLQ